MVGFDSVYQRGQTRIQIGNNKNLSDWTYVENAAHAHVLALDKLRNPDGSRNPKVCGQVFFITNDEPWHFWDFGNAIWDRMDAIYPGKRPIKKQPIIIPQPIGLVFGAISEVIAWLRGEKAVFSRYSVIFTCTTRTYDISKAKSVLGYKPRVSMEEGIDLMLDWWKTQAQAQQ